MQPVFPKSFNNPVRVRSGIADVSAVPLNANPDSAAQLDAAGNLVYPNAFGPGIDVVYRCEPLKTEEFIVIQGERSEAASPLSPRPLREGLGGGVPGLCAFSWELNTGSLKPRLTPAHTIELCDETGAPRLRINAPEGKDASGKFLRVGKELRITLEGNRVTLAADTRSLEFPIVIDPTWSSTGAMAEARSQHQQVTLPSGKVLVGPPRAGAPAGVTGLNCELYDPGTETWSATGQTNNSMNDATFTLLLDGKVLAAGGAMGVAELYDPATGVWTSFGSSTVRSAQSAILLDNGSVLISGGGGTDTCELYNPGTGNFTPTGNMTVVRGSHGLVKLSNGTILAVGGANTAPLNSCEIYDPASGTWSATGSMSLPRNGHTTTLLGSGKVLAAGGFVDGNNCTDTSEVYDPATGAWTASQTMRIPRSSHIAVRLRTGKALIAGGRPGASSGIGTTSCELFNPSTGAMEAFPDAPAARWLHAASVLANGFVLVTGGPALNTCDLLDPNFAPQSNPSASPSGAIPGQTISFVSNTTDPDNDALTYAWDFGDGSTSTEANPTHSYAAVGSYNATLVVKDTSNASASVIVPIQISLAPIVRVQTSDVVAFATQPFTFDASTSSDPENAIAFYDWDFGDGTPHGSQQIITKVYDQPGTYTIKLTITDSAGVSSSTTRIIEVLGASEAGLFNGFINYKVSWNRTAENKDSLSLDASVNVGDDVIAAGTPVALEIVGQRFEGTLDTKLRDTSNPNEKWTVKANLRHQPPGSVSIKLSLKKANIGSAFNLAGVLVGGDPHDIVSKTIPVHLEIGARSFELQVDSDFKFSGNGTRAKGDGASD